MRVKDHPLYTNWISIRTLCRWTKGESYPYFGGRGIKVCDRWRNDFWAFVSDMPPKPSPEHSVERIDNDGDFEPSNVKWGTRTEQTRNRSVTLRYTIGAQTLTLLEWCDLYGKPYDMVFKRVNYHGWDILEALTKPAKEAKLYTMHGKTRSMDEWCAACGTSRQAVRFRMKKYGWTLEKALFTPKRQS